MDVTMILDDMFNHTDPQIHVVMTGFTFLFGQLDMSDLDTVRISLEKHYHAISHLVFSLYLEALVQDPTDMLHANVISDDLTCLFLDMDDVDPDFVAKIWSIPLTASNPQCPCSFSAL